MTIFGLTLRDFIEALFMIAVVAALLGLNAAVRKNRGLLFKVVGLSEVVRSAMLRIDDNVFKTWRLVRQIAHSTRKTTIMIAVSLDCTKTYVIKNPQAVQRDAEENPVGEPKPVEGFELSIESQQGNFGTVTKNADGDFEFNAGDLSQGEAKGVLLGKGMVEGVEATGRLSITLEPGAAVETELTFQLDVKAEGEGTGGESKPGGEGAATGGTGDDKKPEDDQA